MLTFHVQTKKVLRGRIRRWVRARSPSRTNRRTRSRYGEGLRALGRARLLRRCCAALDSRFLDRLERYGCVRPTSSILTRPSAGLGRASLIHLSPFAFVSRSPRRRGAHHASALLSLIDRFPRKNPRPDDEGVDMGAQLRLIRSRYKAMCASLGVRARLQPAPLSVGSESGTVTGPPGASGGDEALTVAPGERDLDDADADTEKKRQRQKTIWPLAAPPTTSPSVQDLSF